MTKAPILAVLLLLGRAAPLRAIELSLEENRAERGNIGFVDMQRLFQLFPETLKAKENFAESVRQAEEQINLRKAEVLRLRAELDGLKVERELLAKSMPAAAAPVSTATPPAPSTAPAAAAQAPASASAPSQPAPGISSTTAESGPLPAAPSGEGARLPSKDGGPLPAALKRLDERISQKTKDLARQEAESREQQAATEKNLLDLESRKSELLLGKLYRAVVEVSRREGVSVVVDKGAIIYGHNAVDLTDKVLKYLKGG